MNDSEGPPQFIRKFSKDQEKDNPKPDVPGEQPLTPRQQTAQLIKEARAKYFQRKQQNGKEKTELGQVIPNKEIAAEEALARLQQLKQEVESLNGNWFSRLINYSKLKGLGGELTAAEEGQEQAQTALQADLARQSELAQTPALAESTELEDSRKLLQNFYNGQKYEWANTPYNKEDIAYYFSEAHLAKLTLPEYVLLLRRFPSEMLTHVTRQGIRDHVGMADHTAGEGEFWQGFTALLKDGRQRSNFGAAFKDGMTKEAVAKCLELGGVVTNEQDARTYLDQFTGLNGVGVGGTGSYEDRLALHFAAEAVADEIYGAETGNEMFFAYPAALLASQFYFSVSSDEGLVRGANLMHNDKWVWAKDEQGVSINAGLVFVPADAQVDRQTGSRYQMGSDQKPIVNAEGLSQLRLLVESASFDDLITKQQLSNEKGAQPSVLADIKQQLSAEFGITDPRLQEALLGENFSILKSKLETERSGRSQPKDLNYMCKTIMVDAGMYYKEAVDTVPSQKYWEDYFLAHPQERPTKVVFYQGGDPTKALREWKAVNGLSKTANDPVHGFDENKAENGTNDATISRNRDRFRSIGLEVIEEFYNKPSVKK